MIALALVLALVIGVVLFLLYGALENYEKTTPRAAINGYFEALAAGDYEDLKASSGFTPDEMNTWDNYFAQVKSRFTGVPAEYVYRKVVSTDTDLEHYAVYLGDEKLGEVVLRPDKTAEHGYTVSTAVDLLTPYTVRAPGHAVVQMNGADLLPSDPGVAVTEVPGFEELADPAQRPVVYEYTLQPTLAEPTFTAAAPGGNECTVQVDTTTRRVDVAVVPTPEQDALFRQRMQEAAEAYASFTTSDSPFSALAGYLVPGSTLRDSLSTYYAGWYLDHESTWVENLEITNLQSLSDTCFSGDISFIYNVQRNGEVHAFDANYHMNFVLQDGQWLLLSMKTF